ncbi:hypothetical protein GGX14DRAFT_391822 [Mycena pura]|uniref:Uncharacterized protein n=1 Tax=Mycena pura TaxID=153505 RepID=A0AAD6VL10_9AGAR|nr:hypothetical protein GGX14DRAFT_391822 [Mycena pura]
MAISLLKVAPSFGKTVAGTRAGTKQRCGKFRVPHVHSCDIFVVCTRRSTVTQRCWIAVRLELWCQWQAPRDADVRRNRGHEQIGGEIRVPPARVARWDMSKMRARRHVFGCNSESFDTQKKLRWADRGERYSLGLTADRMGTVSLGFGVGPLYDKLAQDGKHSLRTRCLRCNEARTVSTCRALPACPYPSRGAATSPTCEIAKKKNAASVTSRRCFHNGAAASPGLRFQQGRRYWRPGADVPVQEDVLRWHQLLATMPAVGVHGGIVELRGLGSESTLVHHNFDAQEGLCTSRRRWRRGYFDTEEDFKIGVARISNLRGLSVMDRLRAVQASGLGRIVVVRAVMGRVIFEAYYLADDESIVAVSPDKCERCHKAPHQQLGTSALNLGLNQSGSAYRHALSIHVVTNIIN